MLPTRRLTATIVAATAAAGLALTATPGHAATQDDARTHATIQQPTGQSTMARAQATTAWVLFGVVYGPDGTRWDNVSVTATQLGDSRPTASSITYGGGYDLHVPVGSYKIAFHDLSGRVPDFHLDGVVAIGPRDPDEISLGDQYLTYGPARSTAAPSVTGSARVGGILKAAAGTWNADSLNYSYTWLVDGTAAGRGALLRVKPGMAGKGIQVKVTAQSRQWSPGAATSAVQTVAKARTRMVAALRDRAPGRAVLSVSVSHLDGPAARGLVRVTERGRLLAKASLSNHATGRIAVGHLKPGPHKLTITWRGPSWSTLARDTVRVTVTR